MNCRAWIPLGLVAALAFLLGWIVGSGTSPVERRAPSSDAYDASVTWGPEDKELSIAYASSEWPPETKGEIEWRVGGVTGAMAIPASRAGENVQLTATTRIPVSAVVRGVEAVEVLDETGAPILVGGPEEVSANLFSGTDELGYTNEENAASNVRNWLLARGGEAMTAIRGLWWVSRPGAAGSGGTVRLHLELGGYLLVHQPTPLPTSPGSLRVERVDGTWLGGVYDGGTLPNFADVPRNSPSSVDAITNGTLLGPLPPGDVALRFLLGGIEVGRANAKVVAGQVSILTIR